MDANAIRPLSGAVPLERASARMRIFRLIILITCVLTFFPQVNPARISLKINENASLFTTAVSYDTITNSMALSLRRGWVQPWHFYLLMAGAALCIIGIALSGAGGCMSLGNDRMRKRGFLFATIGPVGMWLGLGVIYLAYHFFSQTDKIDRVAPHFPSGFYVFAVLAALILVLTILNRAQLPKQVEARMEMDEKYSLFLMMLPVLFLAFLFCYLPIFGWRFAFFDYRVGDALTAENFVGFKWFSYLFENAATRADLARVLRNTLIMSGLGIVTSWLPIAFAVLLTEIRSRRFQRFVQTFTTIPNFISWVLIYAFALAIFSTDGFINSFLRNVMGQAQANTDYLADASYIWLKMLAWGTWKGLGWSAIIYIAGIAGIDQTLYEAARVDGASRFQCIWHVTIPGLMPTYCVMLLMSIAGILSNGMEQYLVFENAMNKETIEVLDLYVYNIGIKQGLIPISTVVGIAKSVVGVTMLFVANRISKSIRGESIV